MNFARFALFSGFALFTLFALFALFAQKSAQVFGHAASLYFYCGVTLCPD
jgi:hypothetical protein